MMQAVPMWIPMTTLPSDASSLHLHALSSHDIKDTQFIAISGFDVSYMKSHNPPISKLRRCFHDSLLTIIHVAHGTLS